ncbi:hypothetical protein [Natronocalculus amylovorans]|uniref:CbaC protein n=1 Tax=Natronocalculus amylovorans TaxID=2917812 RepID=A0AAE3FZ47_9EURY|nr:hypothetical protein [Natronocalculus amylovorans]MCL9818063.1 hypothetical protein [Natronocalculus amylovorans]NUE03943.1 hypothetical protein [Halorubraceae archaeon YAN]
MSETSRAGLLIGGAVLFVILWEIRSALGVLFRIDTNIAVYTVVTFVVILCTLVALDRGLIGFGSKEQ